MRSRHDLKTLIHEAIGQCVDNLPGWIRQTLISHAALADGEGDNVPAENVRSEVVDKWKELNRDQ